MGLLIIGLTTFFAWPRIWEHLNASEINRLRQEARVDLLNNQPGLAKEKYEELRDLVGDRKIHNAQLRDVVNGAQYDLKKIEEALAAAQGNGSTAPTVFVSVSGQVTVPHVGAATQPVAGVTVVALQQRMPSAQLRDFYEKVIQIAADEEQSQRHNAVDLRTKANAPDISPTDQLTWRQFAASDDYRAKTCQAFIKSLTQTSRTLPAQQDLAQVRLEMLEVDLHLRMARGKSAPNADFTKDLIGTDFDSVIQATRLAEAVTDSAGNFTLKDVPAARFYLYAYWHSGNRVAEWLVPVESNSSGPVQKNLGWDNTAAHN